MQLRTAVRDIPDVAGKDDYYFLRWLRARNFDVRKAENMIRNVSNTPHLYVTPLSIIYTLPFIMIKCIVGL